MIKKKCWLLILLVQKHDKLSDFIVHRNNCQNYKNNNNSCNKSVFSLKSEFSLRSTALICTDVHVRSRKTHVAFTRVTTVLCSKSYLSCNFCCFVLACTVPPLDPAGNCSFWTRQDGRDLGEPEKERVKEGQGRPKTRSRKPEPNIRKILEQHSGSTEADAIRS